MFLAIFSKDLIKTKFPLTSSPDTFDLTSESFQSILQSVVNNSSTQLDFLVKAKDSFVEDPSLAIALQGNLIQVGSFLDIVNTYNDSRIKLFPITSEC